MRIGLVRHMILWSLHRPHFCAVFSALRVYTISGHNILLASITLLFGLAPVVVNIAFDIAPAWFIGSRGCTLVPHFKLRTVFILMAYERSSMIAADVVVLCVTWYNVYEARGTIDWSNARLSTLLLRDGTVNFIILLVLNVLQIASWVTESFSAVTLPAQVATSMLISRFFLNLRQGSEVSAGPSINQTTMFNMAFASRVVGNIGAELDYGLDKSPAEDLSESEESMTLDEDSWDSDATQIDSETRTSQNQV